MLTLAVASAAAPVSAVEVATALSALGFPVDTERQVRGGQFVQTSLPTTSERDLNVGIAFLVKQEPWALAKKLREEQVLQKVDPGTIAFGTFAGDGVPADLARLTLTPMQRDAYLHVGPGAALNLSRDELAALKAAGTDPAAVEQSVRAALLARYRAYRAQGLGGIAPYARNGGETDPAADFRKMDQRVRASQVLPTAFYDLLEGYPKNVPPDVSETFSWQQFTAHGQDTLALVHVMQGTFGGSLVTVQRQYYASTGYNAVQAIVGFLPTDGGTLVVYTNHTSTDQVAGFGGGAKRTLGRKFMASELEKLFERARAAVAR